MKTEEKFYYIFNKFIDKLDFIVPLESFIFSILVQFEARDEFAARWSASGLGKKQQEMIIF